MRDLAALRPWLESVLASYPETILYGFADLGPFLPVRLKAWPHALSFAVRMDEELMDSIQHGPTAPYYAEYKRVNTLIDGLAGRIAAQVEAWGYRAHCIHSSQRTDPERIAGEFPHKTGAVQAGLGWIGRNCQLITRAFGPRVRLGTVLTDMPIGNEPSAAYTRSFCGDCEACVQACPAGALTGALWVPGMERDVLFNAQACDQWKREHYAAFDSNVCGICTAACPMGIERQRERKRTGDRPVL